MRSRTVFMCAVVVITLCLTVGPAYIHAQEANFPTKPITIIVPFGPGGIIDVGTRIFAESLSKELKVPVIIDNKAGGAGLTGTMVFTNTKPDGYTLLSASGGAVISTVQLSKTPSLDPRKDLLPVGYIADSPCAMSVSKTAPFKSFAEFLQYTKANPGKVRGGVSSIGGETHMMFAALVADNKLDTKMIPYPATGGLVTAIMGGHLDWMTLSLPATLPYSKSGDVKIVLLTRRSSELPGVPSGADVGLPNVSINLWMGIFAHPKTPKAIHDKLVAAVEAASKDPEVAKKLQGAGFTVGYKNPADFTKLMNVEWDTFARIIKAADIKLD